jgi:hypothetical protein
MAVSREVILLKMGLAEIKIGGDKVKSGSFTQQVSGCP